MGWVKYHQTHHSLVKKGLKIGMIEESSCHISNPVVKIHIANDETFSYFVSSDMMRYVVGDITSKSSNYKCLIITQDSTANFQCIGWKKNRSEKK